MKEPNWKEILKKELPKHQKPSPKTIKLFQNMDKEITNIKINMAEQQRDIKYIKQKLDDHITRQDRDMEEIRNLQKESNEKVEVMFGETMKGFTTKLLNKADKEVVDKIQGDIRWVVYTIIGCVIVGIIGFVFFK